MGDPVVNNKTIFELVNHPRSNLFVRSLPLSMDVNMIMYGCECLCHLCDAWWCMYIYRICINEWYPSSYLSIVVLHVRQRQHGFLHWLPMLQPGCKHQSTQLDPISNGRPSMSPRTCVSLPFSHIMWMEKCDRIRRMSSCFFVAFAIFV